MPSFREDTANALADTLICGGLFEGHGVNVVKAEDSKGKSFWGLKLKKGDLNGLIRVYSERYIQITWTTTAKIPGVKAKGVLVCGGEWEAKEFLQKFVNR